MTFKKPERIAVMSCVHGNVSAFEAVLEDIRKQGADRIVCLGDLIGYGPYPNEVVEMVETLKIPTVKGCWDEGIGEERGDCGCKFATEEDAQWGHTAFDWTKNRIKEKNRKILNELDGSLIYENSQAGNLLFVHGSPKSATEYLTDKTHDLILLERTASAGADVLFCGHTHVPFVKRISGTLRVAVEADTLMPLSNPNQLARPVEMKAKLVVNVGSVGEPRHGSPEATYVVFDTSTEQVEIRYVEYDYEKTIQAMKSFKLPKVFSERLRQGKELAVKNKEMVCAC